MKFKRSYLTLFVAAFFIFTVTVSADCPLGQNTMKDLYTYLLDPEKNRLYYMTESERKQKNFSDKDILNSIPKKSRGKGKSKVYKDSDAEE